MHFINVWVAAVHDAEKKTWKDACLKTISCFPNAHMKKKWVVTLQREKEPWKTGNLCGERSNSMSRKRNHKKNLLFNCDENRGWNNKSNMLLLPLTSDHLFWYVLLWLPCCRSSASTVQHSSVFTKLNMSVRLNPKCTFQNHSLEILHRFRHQTVTSPLIAHNSGKRNTSLKTPPVKSGTSNYA